MKKSDQIKVDVNVLPEHLEIQMEFVDLAKIAVKFLMLHKTNV